MSLEERGSSEVRRCADCLDESFAIGLGCIKRHNLGATNKIVSRRDVFFYTTRAPSIQTIFDETKKKKRRNDARERRDSHNEKRKVFQFANVMTQSSRDYSTRVIICASRNT